MTRTSARFGLLMAALLLAGCGDRNAQTADTNTDSASVPPPATAQAPVPDASTPGAPAASSPADNRLVEPRRSAGLPASGGSGRRAEDARRAPGEAPLTGSEGSASRPSPAPPVEEWREVTVARGTALPLELMTALSSETASVEAPVRARLRQPVVVNGYTALPAGTVLTGQVTDVERSGRVQGRAHLAFAFTEAMIDGSREDLRSDPLTFEAEATKGEDATKVGAGAGVGAVIGGLLGGGKGAAKGAAIGGAAGTGAVLATRGKEVELAAGRDLTATLAAPLTVRVLR